MPSVDHPCLLLPPLVSKSATYLCLPVDTSVADRSCILKSLMEVPGVARLPDGVTFEGFRAWSTIHASDVDTVPVEDISHVLQVRNASTTTCVALARLQGTAGQVDARRCVINAVCRTVTGVHVHRWPTSCATEMPSRWRKLLRLRFEARTGMTRRPAMP